MFFEKPFEFFFKFRPAPSFALVRGSATGGRALPAGPLRQSFSEASRQRF